MGLVSCEPFDGNLGLELDAVEATFFSRVGVTFWRAAPVSEGNDGPFPECPDHLTLEVLVDGYTSTTF